MRKRWWIVCVGVSMLTASFAGCGGNGTQPGSDSGSDADIDGNTGDAACAATCSADGTKLVDCNGKTVQSCAATETCNPSTLACVNTCTLAATAKSSVGC